MILWDPSSSNNYPAINRRNIPSVPLLDYLILAAMIVIGTYAYRAISVGHGIERASSGTLRTAVVMSCPTPIGGSR